MRRRARCRDAVKRSGVDRALGETLTATLRRLQPDRAAAARSSTVLMTNPATPGAE